MLDKGNNYHVADTVLLRRVHRLTVLNSPFLGPFKILLKVKDNHGTVHSMEKSIDKSLKNVRRCYVSYHSGTDLDHGGECNMRTSRKRS